MLLSYEIESLRRPRKKTRRQQTISFVILRSDLNYRCARTAHQTTRKESVVAVTGKITFSLIQFLSCPAPSVDVGRFVRKKKTESRRRLARSRIHVALAHTQLVRVIVVVVVRLRLLSQAAQVLLFLDGCQVRSLRRQTKRGLAQYRYRFRNGRRLVFSFGRRRAGRRNYVFFSFFFFFLLRPFFLISFLLLLASYLFLCAFPGHQNLLI